jgi:hypothetical protein
MAGHETDVCVKKPGLPLGLLWVLSVVEQLATKKGSIQSSFLQI